MKEAWIPESSDGGELPTTQKNTITKLMFEQEKPFNGIKPLKYRDSFLEQLTVYNYYA